MGFWLKAGYGLTALTVALWAIPALIGASFRLPDWALIMAGLVISTFFTFHAAAEYT